MILKSLETAEGGALASESGRCVISYLADRVQVRLRGGSVLVVQLPVESHGTTELFRCLVYLLSQVEESDSDRIRGICGLVRGAGSYPAALTRLRVMALSVRANALGAI